MMRAGYSRTSWAWLWAPLVPQRFVGWRAVREGGALVIESMWSPVS